MGSDGRRPADGRKIAPTPGPLVMIIAKVIDKVMVVTVMEHQRQVELLVEQPVVAAMNVQKVFVLKVLTGMATAVMIAATV